MSRKQRLSAVIFSILVAATLFDSPRVFALSESQKAGAQAQVGIDANDGSTLSHLWEQHISALETDEGQNLLDAVNIDWNESSQRSDFIWTVSQAGILPYMITGDTAEDQRNSIHSLMRPYIETLMTNADRSETVRQAYRGLSALNRISNLVPADMQNAAHEKYRATCIVAHPIRHRIKKTLTNAREAAKGLAGTKDNLEPRGSDTQTSEVEGAFSRAVPEYARLRKPIEAPDQKVGDLMVSPLDILTPEMSRDSAVRLLRRTQAAKYGTATEDDSHHAFVVDSRDQKHLLGLVPLRRFITALDEERVNTLMNVGGLITAHINMDSETATRLLHEHNLDSIPVINSFGRLVGVFTHHAAAKVSAREAAEDIHKMGGQSKIDTPYLETLWRKSTLARAIPLLIICAVELLLTIRLMDYLTNLLTTFAPQLQNYIPLILTIGGNTGAQSTTHVIRSFALNELRQKHWWRVGLKELANGVGLGILIGGAGFAVAATYEFLRHTPHFLSIASTVGVSAFGVSISGTILGAMLPFLLRRFKVDPANSSASLLAMIGDSLGLATLLASTLLILGSLLH